MGTVPIQGLMYNGKQCSYDDGATTQPPTTGGDAPQPGAGPNSYLYSKVKVGTPDNFYLGKKVYDYRQDLKDLPGSQQVYFDILTNNYGKRYSDANPSPAGYYNDPSMKQHIDTLINDSSYNGQNFDQSTYTGPLKAIYEQLVVDKKAGIVGPPV
jgi:hypothetical protein